MRPSGTPLGSNHSDEPEQWRGKREPQQYAQAASGPGQNTALHESAGSLGMALVRHRDAPSPSAAVRYCEVSDGVQPSANVPTTSRS